MSEVKSEYQTFAEDIVRFSQESYDAGYKAARHDLAEQIDKIGDLDAIEYARKLIEIVKNFIP